MNDIHDGRERLLDDILKDEEYRRWLGRIRRRCLDELRNRQRWQRVRLGALVAVAAGLVFALFLPFLVRDAASPVPAPPEGTSAARHPTPRPPLGRLVEGTNLRIVSTSDVPARVETISDEELLALFGERPCALVQVGPGSKRLILFAPEDKKRVFGGDTD